ncbi:MAG: Uma2 family endonuclease [Verrucomicrobiales bacterium]
MASPTLALDLKKCEELLARESEERSRFRDELLPHQKAEFINGQVLMHSPAKAIHNQVRGLIERILGTHVDAKRDGLLSSEKALCGFTRNDYEPDIVWFGPKKAAQILPETLVHPVPDFAIEILSPSTTDNDRGVKFVDYAAHGVAEYWIVDPDKQIIEQYQREEDQYTLVTTLREGDLTPLSFPELHIPHAAMFAPNANVAFLRSILSE